MKDKYLTRPEDRISIKRKIAVGAGGFPIQNGGLIVQYMAQPIFQIFLGLNPALFGLAMTIPRIWDAFTDPIMGGYQIDLNQNGVAVVLLFFLAHC